MASISSIVKGSCNVAWSILHGAASTLKQSEGRRLLEERMKSGGMQGDFLVLLRSLSNRTNTFTRLASFHEPPAHGKRHKPPPRMLCQPAQMYEPKGRAIFTASC